MHIRDVYLDASCNGNRINNNDLYNALGHYKAAVEALIVLGPAFTIAFKEANQCYLWLESVAKARGML